MSIASRMKEYSVYGPSTKDEYGARGTDVLLGTAKVSITKNNPSSDDQTATFITTEYIGITTYQLKEGDILLDSTTKYQVKTVGERGSNYLYVGLVSLWQVST